MAGPGYRDGLRCARSVARAQPIRLGILIKLSSSCLTAAICRSADVRTFELGDLEHESGCGEVSEIGSESNQICKNGDFGSAAVTLDWWPDVRRKLYPLYR